MPLSSRTSQPCSLDLRAWCCRRLRQGCNTAAPRSRALLVASVARCWILAPFNDVKVEGRTLSRDDPQTAPSLKPGTRLGPYEILEIIGSGGMGEVYRAHDARLDRTVAIKVLPPHLALSRESRARFEGEARAVAALKHPHICVLHDVGREGDLRYLVMELVEGETLASRLE